jgi:hypothetical protein
MIMRILPQDTKQIVAFQPLCKLLCEWGVSLGQPVVAAESHASSRTCTSPEPEFRPQPLAPHLRGSTLGLAREPMSGLCKALASDTRPELWDVAQAQPTGESRFTGKFCSRSRSANQGPSQPSWIPSHAQTPSSPLSSFSFFSFSSSSPSLSSSFFFEKGSHCLSQTGLKLIILLSQVLRLKAHATSLPLSLFFFFFGKSSTSSVSHLPASYVHTWLFSITSLPPDSPAILKAQCHWGTLRKRLRQWSVDRQPNFLKIS